MTDTIFALSSGRGASGVAVIRISGHDLHAFMARILGKSEIKKRHAYFCNLKDEHGDLIDQCIAIYFVAPASFTGEDVIELYTHGAPAVIDAVFEFLRASGFRMAECGEFTRRAFANNKMDLVGVDGLAALLNARTDRQRRFALKSVTGASSDVYEKWRADMIEIAAYAAVMLDYPADELPADILNRTQNRAKKLYDEMSMVLSRAAFARAISAGFNITMMGPVNVGKSSLFNAIVGHARAIVSDVPGTTRDVIHADIDMDGYLVRLNDTAGLRATDDAVEKIGIDKTNAEIAQADLILRIETQNSISAAARDNEILVINKSDLLDKSEIGKIPGAFYTSVATGAGVTELLNEIKSRVHEMLGGSESDVVVSLRARKNLSNAVLELAKAVGDKNLSPDLFAFHVQNAADSVGRILGVIGADEIMDTVFSQLCLGK